MKQYAQYLRKSRAEEGMELEEVLAKHRRALAELAEKQHIVIADTYEEIVSGESIALRPQMLLLLDAVEQGRYAGVLCMDIDRLGRGGMRDQGLILDTFRTSPATKKIPMRLRATFPLIPGLKPSFIRVLNPIRVMPSTAASPKARAACSLSASMKRPMTLKSL